MRILSFLQPVLAFRDDHGAGAIEQMGLVLDTTFWGHCDTLRARTCSSEASDIRDSPARAHHFYNYPTRDLVAIAGNYCWAPLQGSVVWMTFYLATPPSHSRPAAGPVSLMLEHI